MKTKAALYDRRSAILSLIFAIFCSMAFTISGCVSSKQYYEQVLIRKYP